MRQLLSMFFILLLSFSALAASPGVEVEVDLFPAGDFVVKSGKLKGKVHKKGNLFYAKKLRVAIKSLKTGISTRDKHLWKRLNPKKNAAIVVTNAKGKNGKGAGVIEINGVKKKIGLRYQDIGDGLLEVSFSLSLSDFKIKDIDYKLVKVEDEVRVKARVPVASGGRGLAGGR